MSRSKSSNAFRGSLFLPCEERPSKGNWPRVEAIAINTIHYHFLKQISTTGSPQTSSNLGNCLTIATMESQLVITQNKLACKVAVLRS